MRQLVVVLLLAAAVGAAYQHEEVWMPMRDSVLLKTDIYYPDSSSLPWPAVLWRTPYPHSTWWPSYGTSALTDSMGYVVVLQYMRGWQGSQGERTMFQTDGWGALRDGNDAVEWIAAQSWSNGKICMTGFCAMGAVQYQATGASPPHLVCCCPDRATSDGYLQFAWTGGQFRKALIEGWCANQGALHFIDSVCNHPGYDSVWRLCNLAERWDSAAYPMFHMGGWYGYNLEGALDAYTALQTRFRDQKLLVGPWCHFTGPSRQQGALLYPANAALPERARWELNWRWFDHWMQDSVNGITEPRVCFYLMGDCDTEDTTFWNRWCEDSTWPPCEVEYRDYYFRDDTLLDTEPPSGSAVDTFQYDPADPCTTYGGKEVFGLANGVGPQDQRPIEGRSDVLVFQTPVLEQGLAVIGKIRCVLYAASDRYDTDWTVRVTDVYPDGRSMLITDGILMARHRHGFDREDSLVPGVPDTFDIDVGSTANVFAPGHRLRVIISSSNYPRFEKNPNTGAPFQRDPTECLVATQHVYRSAALPSHLVLPVHPDLPGVAESPAAEVRRQSGPTVVRGVLRWEVAGSRQTGDGAELLDIAGRMVMELEPGENDVSRLAPGVYFVRPAGTVPIRAKVVVQR